MKASTLKTIRVVANIITVLAICLIVYLVLTNSSCLGRVNIGGSFNDVPGDYEIRGQYEIDDEIDELIIDWVDGSVIIEVDDAATIRFFESARDPISEKDALRFTNKNGKLYIEQRKSSVGFIFTLSKQNKHLTIKWPREKQGDLEIVNIDTVSASLEITELSTSRQINLESVSGATTLSQIDTLYLDIETVSGPIKGESVSAERFNIESVSAGVDLGVVNAKKIDVETVSGAVTLKLGEVDRAHVNFESFRGQQTIGEGVVIDSDAALGIDVKTTSGNLNLER